MDSPVFRVALIEGKGFGAFATRLFEPGSVVLEEVPILTLAGNHTDLELDEAVASLADEEKAAFWSCTSNNPQATASSVFYNNAYCADDKVCFYTTLSRFNHSCTPNVVVSFTDSRAQLRALCRIPCGDELCTSYVDVCCCRDQRRELLQSRYAFLCHCSTCAMEQVELSDRRRSQLSVCDDVAFHDVVALALRDDGDTCRACAARVLVLRVAQVACRLVDVEGLHVANRTTINCCFAAVKVLAGSPDLQRSWANELLTRVALIANANKLASCRDEVEELCARLGTLPQVHHEASWTLHPPVALQSENSLVSEANDLMGQILDILVYGKY